MTSTVTWWAVRHDDVKGEWTARNGDTLIRGQTAKDLQAKVKAHVQTPGVDRVRLRRTWMVTTHTTNTSTTDSGDDEEVLFDLFG